MPLQGSACFCAWGQVDEFNCRKSICRIRILLLIKPSRENEKRVLVLSANHILLRRFEVRRVHMNCLVTIVLEPPSTTENASGAKRSIRYGSHERFTGKQWQLAGRPAPRNQGKPR